MDTTSRAETDASRRRAWARVAPAWIDGYRRDTATSDLVAGLTVGAMLIPQAMAYALLAGLPPQVGLYASTLPLLAYAVLGTSRQLAVGPVAIVSLLTASSIGAVVDEGTAGYLEAAAVLALLVGAVHLVLAAVRLGFLVRLLSHPVLVGFTAAAALIIGASQVKHVLGVSVPRTDHFHETIGELASASGDTDALTLAVGITAVVVMVGLRRLRIAWLPGALVAVVAGTVVSAVADLEGRGVAVVGDIPSGLPTPSLPGEWGLVGDLLPAAVVITLVGFMESIAIAKVFARKNHYAVSPNRELIGLGAANVASGVVGGYPVTGGFSRTAVNGDAGAKTPVASIITVAVVAIVLVAFTPLLTQLPTAVLGAIVLVAVAGLFDVREARHIASIKRSDALPMLVAFVATLALGVELGLLVAVGASAIQVFARMMAPHTAVLGRLPGTDLFRNVDRFPEADQADGVAIIRFDVSLSFLNVEFVKQRIEKVVAAADPPLRALVLDAAGVNDIDTSALEALVDICADLDARGITVHLASVKGPVRDVLHRAGFADDLAGRTHPDLCAAMAVLDPEAACADQPVSVGRMSGQP